MGRNSIRSHQPEGAMAGERAPSRGREGYEQVLTALGGSKRQLVPLVRERVLQERGEVSRPGTEDQPERMKDSSFSPPHRCSWC